jgi:hypothetical protein
MNNERLDQLIAQQLNRPQEYPANNQVVLANMMALSESVKTALEATNKATVDLLQSHTDVLNTIVDGLRQDNALLKENVKYLQGLVRDLTVLVVSEPSADTETIAQNLIEFLDPVFTSDENRV